MSTRSLLHWLALVAGAEGLARGHLLARPEWFHAGAWLLAAALGAAAWRRRTRRAGAAALWIAALLPASLSLASAGAPAAPDADPDPRLELWRERADERRLLDEGAPAGAGEVELFGVQIALAPGGARAPRPATPGARYRIVAAGGSSTFGATLGTAESAWPLLLEAAIRRELACTPPVEVLNLGVLGRGLAGVVKGFDSEILPLEPQLLIYESGVHELDELAAQHPSLAVPAFEPTPPRASRPLRRLEMRWRQRADERDWRAARAAVPPDLAPRATLLAGAYRHLLLDARRHGIDVALVGLALALPPDAPAADVRRVEAFDPRARQRLLALDLHRRVLGELAATYRATWIDPAPAPDQARESLFLDLHLRSQAGREQLAELLLAALRPELRDAGCRSRRSEAVTPPRSDPAGTARAAEPPTPAPAPR